MPALALLVTVVAGLALSAAERVTPAALPFTRVATRDLPGAAPDTAALAGAWLAAGYADHLQLVPLTAGTAEAPTTLPIPAVRLACDGPVCVAADAAMIRSIDVTRRVVRWQRPLPGALATDPLVRAGWVFLALDGGRLAALRLADGGTAWITDPGPALAAPPSLDGNSLALVSQAPDLTVRDVQTGRILWQARLTAAPGAPRLGGGRVYLGTEAGDLLAVRADTGALVFRHRLAGRLIGAPALDEDHVYTTGIDGNLRAFDRGNGAQAWVAGLPTRPLDGPVTDEGLVLVALRTAGVQAFLPTRPLAATLASPAAKNAATRFAVPVLIDGRGPGLRVVTVTYDVNDLSRWTLSVVGAAGRLPVTTALPPTVPGLALTLGSR